jgi:hypothetical protein
LLALLTGVSKSRTVTACLIVWWGFIVALNKSSDLGNSRSCTESIDVFSQFGDPVLRDIVYRCFYRRVRRGSSFMDINE